MVGRGRGSRGLRAVFAGRAVWLLPSFLWTFSGGEGCEPGAHFARRAVTCDHEVRQGIDFPRFAHAAATGQSPAKNERGPRSIKAGADTFNNRLWNNQVQASLKDWTLQYNVRNFAAVVAATINSTGWACGEKPDGPYHAGPMFNPLHPTVQEAVIGLAREIAERYARFLFGETAPD